MKKLIITSKTYGIHECTYDDIDHEKVLQHIWCVVPNRNTFYAMTRIKLGYKKYKTLRMHQLFIDSKVIDHKDGNGLNNTRLNLRDASDGQNNYNVGLTKRNKSGYKGVYKYRNGFIATIRKKGKLIHGGTFKDAVSAAKKYNEMAIKHHGEFAWLNKI